MSSLDCLSSIVERISTEYREDRPEQLLKEIDKRRAAYHRFYTNLKWGHAQNYHICLDSGTLGLEKCAEIICGLYEPGDLKK